MCLHMCMHAFVCVSVRIHASSAYIYCGYMHSLLHVHKLIHAGCTMPYPTRHTPYPMPCTPYTVHRAPYNIHHTHCTQHTVQPMACAMYHMSHLTCVVENFAVEDADRKGLTIVIGGMMPMPGLHLGGSRVKGLGFGDRRFWV